MTRRTADGTFDRILTAAQGRAEVDRLVTLDSTSVRGRQHTATEGDETNVGSDAPVAR